VNGEALPNNKVGNEPDLPWTQCLPGINTEGGKREEIMKKLLLVASVAVIVVAITSGAFAAGSTTATVGATASVQAACKFTSNGTIDFGTLDQLTGGLVNATVVNPALWCTKSFNYTITDDNGVNKSGTTYQLKASGSNDYIPYTFTYTKTGTGGGKTLLLSPGITASIAANVYDSVPADSYSDTITLTINY
jgi:spore coat protein U-like protein